MFKHFLPNGRASREEAFYLKYPTAEASTSPKRQSLAPARQKKYRDPSLHARQYSPECWTGSNYHVPGFCVSTDGTEERGREPRAFFMSMCTQPPRFWWLQAKACRRHHN